MNEEPKADLHYQYENDTRNETHSLQRYCHVFHSIFVSIFEKMMKKIKIGTVTHDIFSINLFNPSACNTLNTNFKSKTKVSHKIDSK